MQVYVMKICGPGDALMFTPLVFATREVAEQHCQQYNDVFHELHGETALVKEVSLLELDFNGHYDEMLKGLELVGKMTDLECDLKANPLDEDQNATN